MTARVMLEGFDDPDVRIARRRRAVAPHELGSRCSSLITGISGCDQPLPCYKLPSCVHGHSAPFGASCRHGGECLTSAEGPQVFEELSGVRDRRMIVAMPTMARRQQRYDHRLRNLVQRTGDVTVATDLGVPRSTARGWLGGPTVVVCLDVADPH